MTTELLSRPTTSRQEEHSIPVAEIFGPTIQGEGALAGRPTYFLRIAGCDYKCAWCDTDQAVLPDYVRQLPRLTPNEIIERLGDLVDRNPGPMWLAISGGNPALYDLTEVVQYWRALDFNGVPGKITVETQGSMWRPWLGDVDVLTVSPKPPSAEQQFRKHIDIGTFLSYAGGAYDYWYTNTLHVPFEERFTDTRLTVLKVVVFDEVDYHFARDLHQTYPLVPFYLSTGTAMGGLSGKWTPPNGSPILINGEWIFARHADSHRDSKNELLERYHWLVERAAADPAMADVPIFCQLHALIWGINTKGV